MTRRGAALANVKNQGLPLGKWGEQKASEFLARKGMVLLQRNFQIREGEIDLVMEDSGTLVFVEVKTRASLRFGAPEDSLTRGKFERMSKAAYAYMESIGPEPAEWRIDVVAIECSPERIIRRLDHYPNIGLMEA